MPKAKTAPKQSRVKPPLAELPPVNTADVPFAPPQWPASTVAMRPVAALIPYARNSRTHSPEQIKQIAASITEFGFTVPVLVDEDGMIIAGHGRALAAQTLGLIEVPCMTARGWTDTQKRAYVIADNKLTEAGGWNDALLSLELGEIRDTAPDFSIELTGVSAGEMDSLGLTVRDVQPPDEFRAYGDDIATDTECPKCKYRWASGKK